MRHVTIVAISLFVLLVGTAQANSPRVTKGDAKAVLQASGAGGWAMALNGHGQGAAADFLLGSKARISPSFQWNGTHFCSLDWHVVSLALIDGNSAGGSRTNAEIRQALAASGIVFTLDGTTLGTVRTPVKRFLNPESLGLVEAYYFNEGRLLAPEDLAVGAHSLEASIVFDGVLAGVLGPITFFIDTPGTGACL